MINRKEYRHKRGRFVLRLIGGQGYAKLRIELSLPGENI